MQFCFLNWSQDHHRYHNFLYTQYLFFYVIANAILATTFEKEKNSKNVDFCFHKLHFFSDFSSLCGRGKIAGKSFWTLWMKGRFLAKLLSRSECISSKTNIIQWLEFCPNCEILMVNKQRYTIYMKFQSICKSYVIF